MNLELDHQRAATILAALRHYLDQGLGDPNMRTDEVHRLATLDDSEISLDQEGTQELFDYVMSVVEKNTI